jgi:hypothetical protein
MRKHRTIVARPGFYRPSLLKDFRTAAPGMKLLLGLYLLQMLLGLAAGFAAPWVGWKF